MRRVIPYILVAILSVMLIIKYCSDEGDSELKKENHLVTKHNFIVLLDLSDRILNEDQIKRDKELITYIYDSFLEKLKDELYFAARDEFKIAIAYQDEGVKDAYVYDIVDRFYVNAEKVRFDQKVKIRDNRGQFITDLDDLYTEAHISDNPNDYNGANIQSYLRNEFNDKVYRDSLSRDFLFIITDGYQYVKGQSGGLNDWDIAGDLTDIETMVLEMDPNKSRPQENNLMTSKWDGWLSKMNAESINLQPKGSLRMIKETIDDFVGNKGIINNSGAVSESKDQGYKEEEEEKSLESNPATSELELSETLYFVNDEKGNIIDDLPYDEPAKPKPTSRSITNTSSSTTSTGFVPQNQVLSAITTSIDNSSSSIRVDSDGDGVPDNLDNCTTRVGEATNNGCPVLQISATRTAIYRDMDAMPYEIERSSTLQSSDEYSWEVNRGGEIEGSKSQRCYVNFPAIGNYVVKCKLKGKDGYSDEIYLNQHVGIRYAELEGLFNQIAQYGNIAILGGNSEPVQKAKNEANSSISSIKAMISPSGCELLKERKSKSANTFFGDDLNSLFNMLQMAKSDPKLEIRDVSINHVGYDRSNGLIDEIRYSIL